MKVKFMERHSTRIVWIHIDDFFRISAIWQDACVQKDTHKHRETGVITTGKICKADLPKSKTNGYVHQPC